MLSLLTSLLEEQKLCNYKVDR